MDIVPIPAEYAILLGLGYELHAFFTPNHHLQWIISRDNELFPCHHGQAYHHLSARTAYYCCLLHQHQQDTTLHLQSHCLGCFRPLTHVSWCPTCPGSYCPTCYTQGERHLIICQAQDEARRIRAQEAHRHVA